MKGMTRKHKLLKAPVELSASEALFAFMGWLTVRTESITLGSTHDSAPAAELVGKFIEHQKLRKPREGYGKLVRSMRDIDGDNLIPKTKVNRNYPLLAVEFPGSNSTIVGREYTEQEREMLKPLNESIPDIPAAEVNGMIITKYSTDDMEARHRFMREGELFIVELENHTPKAVVIGDLLVYKDQDPVKENTNS